MGPHAAWNGTPSLDTQVTNVAWEHTMYVASVVEIRYIKQSLCCTSVNGVTLIHSPQEDKGDTQVECIPLRPLWNPSGQRVPVDRHTVTLVEFGLPVACV